MGIEDDLMKETALERDYPLNYGRRFMDEPCCIYASKLDDDEDEEEEGEEEEEDDGY